MQTKNGTFVLTDVVKNDLKLNPGVSKSVCFVSFNRPVRDCSVREKPNCPNRFCSGRETDPFVKVGYTRDGKPTFAIMVGYLTDHNGKSRFVS